MERHYYRARKWTSQKTRSKFTEKQRARRRGIFYFKKYMATYTKQLGWMDYTDDTVINDILYGLGVALDPFEYRHAEGFEKFKKFLSQRLMLETLKR